MPTLTAAEIAPMAKLEGVATQHQHTMAQAMANAIAKQFATFMQQNQVLPGVPVVAPPPANVGTTVGPGRLTGIVSPKPLIVQEVDKATRELALDAGQLKVLNSLLVEALAQTEKALAQAQMQPGVPVAGGVTSSLGKLMSAEASTLEALLPQELRKLNPGSHIPAAPVMNQPGQVGLCLPTNPAKAVGEMVGKAAKVFVQRVQVLPGIAIQNTVTVGAGKLG